MPPSRLADAKELPSPRWLRTVMVAMASLGITAGFSRFSFAVALPEMTADLFGSYSTAGLVVGINFGVYLVSVLLVRRFSSTLDPSLIIKAGLALAVTGMLVVAMAPTTAVAIAGSALLGFAAGGGFVPVTALIVTVAPPHRRGLAMGLGLAGIGMSIVLTGQIIAVFERWGAGSAWRSAFVAEAVIGLVTLVVAIVHLPALKPVAPAGRPTKGVLHRLPGGWALLACYGLYGFAVATYTGFLVAALRDDRGFSPFHAVLLSSLMGGAMSVAVIVGRISDAVGRKRTIIAGTAMIGLCTLVVPWGVEPGIAASAILAGLLINGVGAVIGAYLGDHLTTTEVTSAMGLLTLAMATAQIAAPPIGGAIADATGSFTATFGVAGTLAALAMFAATRLPPDHREAGRRKGHRRAQLAPELEL